MTLEDIRTICIAMPAITEDIKWGNDLVFSIGGKMFCVAGLNQSPTSASFKVTEAEFEEISHRSGFRPAPYMAKYKWVLIEDTNNMKSEEWMHYLRQSYSLVTEKLPPKIRKQLNLE